MHFENSGKILTLSDADGFSHRFHAFWLRESSSDSEYRDSNTGHKLQDADDIPLDVAITSAETSDELIELAFSDGHRASYPFAKLRQAVEHPIAQELIGEKESWNASLSPLPWYELSALEKDPNLLLNLLNDIARLGFVLVKGIPTEVNGSTRFIDLIGYIRMTNNGGIEDIKSLPTADVYDLSMTNRPLEPHVDNPYRVPQPGYTLLHCIRNDADGGESALIDGLYVAKMVKKHSEELFDALCTVPIVYRYADDQAILENTSPFIDLGVDGKIKHIRFHGRCDQVIATDPKILENFYAARRLYTDLIKSDATQLQFKLNPGEMFMVDNYRLFHARRGFKLGSGVRHMQQAYIDRDVVSSRQKTLLRNIQARPWKSRL